MIHTKLEFEKAVDEYIQSGLTAGILLEDIIDDVERIVAIKADDWFDKNPIVLHKCE